MDEANDKVSARNKLLLLQSRDVEAWELSQLIELSRDDDAAVRDWATFALATRDENSVEVTQTLLDRAADPDFDARSEAIWGLARRRDERALPLLIKALRGDQVGELLIEAAGFFARPELLEALQELQQWWDGKADLLVEVIARCRGERVSSRRIWGIVPANDPSG